MCVSHWQALQPYFFVKLRDQSSEEKFLKEHSE